MPTIADRTFADRHLFRRINLALILGLFWTSLAACVVAALVYDIGRLVRAW